MLVAEICNDGLTSERESASAGRRIRMGFRSGISEAVAVSPVRKTMFFAAALLGLLVIFGASGDLTSRKLIPALYRLHRQQRLPAGTRIVGVARTDFSHDAWRDSRAASTAEFTGEDFEDEDVSRFASSLSKTSCLVMV